MSRYIQTAFCLAALSLAVGVAHAQTAPAMKAKPAAAAATASDDDENSPDQVSRKDKYIQHAFERADTNHDGKIDLAEFKAYMDKYLMRQKAAFDRDFDAADTNHDGKLSRAEVKAANPLLFQHFNDIDTNHDGFLSKHEIRESIRDQQRRVTVEGDNSDEPGDSTKQ